MSLPALKPRQAKNLETLAKLKKRSPDQVLDELLEEALELAQLETDLDTYPAGAENLSEEQALAIATEAVRAVRSGK
jgi:hypothetical protein